MTVTLYLDSNLSLILFILFSFHLSRHLFIVSPSLFSTPHPSMPLTPSFFLLLSEQFLVFLYLKQKKHKHDVPDNHTDRGQDNVANLIYRITKQDFLEQHVHAGVRSTRLPLRVLGGVLRTADGRNVTWLHQHFPCSLGFKKSITLLYWDRNLTDALLVVTPAALCVNQCATPKCNFSKYIKKTQVGLK